jgi:hypothetical protein
VDILVRNGNVWDIYEVKASTAVSEIYLYDIAFQRLVIESCGLKVGKCYVVHLNNEYVRNGDIEPKKMFTLHEVTLSLDAFSKDILKDVQAAQELHDKAEPKTDIHENCARFYECQFKEYCHSHLPTPSVFDLYRIGTKKAFEYYKQGIISFADIRDNGIKLNEKQKRQLDSRLDDLPMHVNPNGIKKWLGELKYPLYFFDFETYQSAVPLFDGHRPYQQIPFQYSIHISHDEDQDPLDHKEFLANPDKCEWRRCAEQMLIDIPDDGGSIIAYYKPFECSRIKEMANQFPDLAVRLLKLESRIVDLRDIFADGHLYHKDMGGSFSIKSVLPAMMPNRDDLDYSKLLDVHNGGEATEAFLMMKNFLDEKKRERIIQSLLMYCKLDTMAMAVVWKELCIQAKIG